MAKNRNQISLSNMKGTKATIRITNMKATTDTKEMTVGITRIKTTKTIESTEGIGTSGIAGTTEKTKIIGRTGNIEEIETTMGTRIKRAMGNENIEKKGETRNEESRTGIKTDTETRRKGSKSRAMRGNHPEVGAERRRRIKLSTEFIW